MAGKNTPTKTKPEEMGHAWYGFYEVVFKNSLSCNESLLRGMKIVQMEAAGGYEIVTRDHPVPSKEIVRLRVAMARLAERGSAPQILCATVAMEFLATGELPGMELMRPVPAGPVVRQATKKSL